MNPALKMVARHHVWAPGAILLVMLSLVIPAVKDNWNVDAISYARIAHYYQTGQFDLAVNGYFGPLYQRSSASTYVSPFTHPD